MFLKHSFRDGKYFVHLPLFIKYVKKSQFHFLNVPVFVSQGDLKNVVVIEEKAEAAETNVKGIPDFWFTIFRNVDMLSELVQVSFFSENNNFCRMINELLLFPVNSECLWNVCERPKL